MKNTLLVNNMIINIGHIQMCKSLPFLLIHTASKQKLLSFKLYTRVFPDVAKGKINRAR